VNLSASSSLHRFLAHGTNRPRFALGAARFHGVQASQHESARVHITDVAELKKCRDRIARHRRLEALALFTLSQCGRPSLCIEA
jgi:hypothetical protein